MPILGKYIFIHIPKCGGTSIEHSYGIDTSNLHHEFFSKTQNLVMVYGICLPQRGPMPL